MREISGFGGGYEATCRAMVVAGLEWFDAHPEAKPVFKQYENITGICSEENQDAKDLTEAIIKPSEGDCTGAMHQACVNHVLGIRTYGWDKYVTDMRRLKKEQEEK